MGRKKALTSEGEGQHRTPCYCLRPQEAPLRSKGMWMGGHLGGGRWVAAPGKAKHRAAQHRWLLGQGDSCRTRWAPWRVWHLSWVVSSLRRCQRHSAAARAVGGRRQGRAAPAVYPPQQSARATAPLPRVRAGGSAGSLGGKQTCGPPLLCSSSPCSRTLAKGLWFLGSTGYPRPARPAAAFSREGSDTLCGATEVPRLSPSLLPNLRKATERPNL